MSGKAAEEPAHATFGASSAHRWLNCPGSIALSENAPEVPESEYAREGTEAHACLEFLLKNRTKLKAAIKTALRQYPADMVGHCEEAAKWVIAKLQQHPTADFFTETKVDSSSFTCAGQFGTLDIGIAEEYGRLLIADFKYGAGIAVDPQGEDGTANPQLAYYGNALAERYEYNFTEVELVVIQPRAYHESGDTVRSVTMPVSELKAWRKVFRDGVLACGDKDAPLNAGKWCKFCPAALSCPELKDEAMRKAQVAFSAADGALTTPEPKMIKLPNLGTVLDACDKLEQWIERVREHAFHVLERGEPIPGFKLVQKRGQRKWKDEGKVIQEAENSFGTAAFSTKILSPAQLEKAFPHLSDWVSKRTVVESSGLTIAREDDKRSAVVKGKAAFEQAALPAAKKRAKVP